MTEEEAEREALHRQIAFSYAHNRELVFELHIRDQAISELQAALDFYAHARWSDLDDDLWTDEDGTARPGRRARQALGLSRPHPTGKPALRRS